MTFNLRLNDTIDEKIKIIAKEEGRSKNRQIEYILIQFVRQYERERGEIKIEYDEGKE